MNRRELVELYLDAWNRRDTAAVIELLHPGAAYYDALWRESCVGSYLAKYIQDALEEDEYWYELIDEPVDFEEGVTYRYAGHKWDGSQIGEKRFEGAEVLTILDSKIVTLSNYYFDPDPKVLAEIAKLSAMRHGVPAYVSGNYGGYKQVHVKHRLLHLMSGDTVTIDSKLTVAELAAKIRCSVDELLRLVEAEFGTEIKTYVGQEHKRYAVELLDI